MQTNLNISLSNLDLPFKASSIMDYRDAACLEVGDKLVVGYLADDEDCSNPLEDCDGMGKLYSAHRHSSTHREMQEALAYDTDWSPDLGLVDDHKKRLRAVWIEMAMNSQEFIKWADENAGARASKTDAYYKRRAAKLWDVTDGEYNYRADSVQDFELWDDVRTKVWNELREEGVIGEKDVVLLDCYEHSGQHWSLTGGGTQCRFDTAQGAGVWVPDNSAREEIDRRAKVYAFGYIARNSNWTRKSGKLRFTAHLDTNYGAEQSVEFGQWHEAFEWLVAKTAKLKPSSRRKAELALQERRGRERAAKELAQGALDEYNAWLAGQCYGVVAATFQKVESTADEPQYEFVVSDECWGYIGDDYAMEEAEQLAKTEAQSLQKKSS